ncbi:Piso0_002133 [Millerozyma farinosa CBS 7064]|uniref:Piso0_002133 protein n=1 Tax=Pichia sorbitophila (strain ATCC MYA-4447 / BCRC 22081 / CBS 7064 / NBRC 10061 / NRRL Y-12695) TaxID=559304 RepID=G8YE77_PICSO|nr:Piso0_002133 [Millerozyma farinosa CBS 7064]
MKIWESIVNKIGELYQELDNNHSPFRLELSIISRNVYQKGLSESEFKETTPPILRGQVTLHVYKPIEMLNLSVRFFGKQIDTVQESGEEGSFESLERRFSCQKKRCSVLIDQLHNWDYRSHTSIYPGTYTFPFEFIADSLLPESFQCKHVSVYYKLESTLLYLYPPSSCLKAATKSENIKLIRCLSDTLFNDSIIATGNWRNLLIYEFSFQNKVAFQNTPYLSILRIYPIDKNALNFSLHSISLILIQTQSSDKIRTKRGRQYTDVNKFLLYKRHINPFSMNCNTDVYTYDIELNIPSVAHNFKEKQYQQTEKKVIYPTFFSDNHGFVNTHSLRITIEVSENAKTKRSSSRANRSSRSSSISISNPKMSESDGVTPPNCATFHERKEGASRFKKIELSFSAPIILLSHDSMKASASPPSYSNSSSNFSTLRSMENSVFSFKSPISPPLYNDITI